MHDEGRVRGQDELLRSVGLQHCMRAAEEDALVKGENAGLPVWVKAQLRLVDQHHGAPERRAPGEQEASAEDHLLLPRAEPAQGGSPAALLEDHLVRVAVRGDAVQPLPGEHPGEGLRELEHP